MSFWNGMKRAFGFSPEEEEEEGEYDPTLPTYAVTKSSDNESEEHHEEQKQPKVSKISSDGSAASALHTQRQAPAPRITPPVHKPAAAQETATPNAKPAVRNVPEKPVADSDLPADLFDAVIKLFNEQQPEFVKTCLSTDAQRKFIIDSLSHSLKSRIAVGKSDLDSLRKENRRLQLSVDRQKRALLDRINDLEAQVARHNDEKEKIYTKKKLPVDTEQLDKANSRVAELEEELKNQISLRKQLETKIQMSDVLINDLRNQGAAARQELEKVQEEQSSVMSHIQEQLDGFEQLKARKDAKIAESERTLAEQEQKLAESEQRISELIKENESLHRTIENNLYAQASTERDLRNEIKELRAKLDITTETSTSTTIQEPQVPEERPSKKRGRPKKVRIDNSLDNTEWFASGKKDDPDFGYHEPPRRPVNDNEAQLTLF